MDTEQVEMIDLCSLEILDDYEPEFDFKRGEDAIFEVIWLGMGRAWSSGFWKEHQIEEVMILRDRETEGALSYEQNYGAGLCETLESLVDVPGPGIYVIEDVTCHFFRGDGWTTDDDVDFDFLLVRPATIEETFDGTMLPYVNFWSSEPENIA